MKKILIMLGSYFPKPNANGICTHQVALSLKKLGYDVHVICFKKKGDQEEDIYEGIKIHRIKMRLFFRLRFYGEDNIDTLKGKLAYKAAMIINKIKKLLFIPFFPMTSPIFIYRYYKKAELLHSRNNFDLILSVYNPLEAIVAGAMLKKYKKVKFGAYFLDPLTNNTKSKYVPILWQNRKGWEWEQRIYNYADVIYNLKCHEKHYQQVRYDYFRDKMKFVDIPLLRPLNKNSIDRAACFDAQYLHWVYTGSLSTDFRDPWYAYEIFNLLISENRNYKFHFYSYGNCEERIMEYEEKTDHAIVRHGYVENEKVISAILSANVLISFGPANSTMIPSKIFEYMATGNPIIHFYMQDNDVCIPYYKKYPLVLMIKQDKKLLKENAKKVGLFIERSKGKHVEFSEIKKFFEMNTPEYTTSMIDSMLK